MKSESYTGKIATDIKKKDGENMEENEIYEITYSVIVTSQNGGTRGYTVKATNRSEAFGKLMRHINFDYVSKVEIAEIVVDMDMIK